MSNNTPAIHPSAGTHYRSACDRFAARHNLEALAADIGMSGHVLRNKFNQAQKHKLCGEDLIALYLATCDDTLFDGLLLDCGLTAVAISPSHDTAPIAHRVIDATAKVAGIGAQAVQVIESGRVTKGQRNALVGALLGAVEHLVLIANEVESKYQTIPSLACAADLARMAAGV